MKNGSNVIFWLLFAATAAVDAIAIYWMHEARTGHYQGVLYDALASSQVSLAAVWAVLGTRHKGVAAIILGIAAAVAAALTAWLVEMDIREWLAFYGAFVTLLVILLWAFKHTAWWRRAVPHEGAVWQFSVL